MTRGGPDPYIRYAIIVPSADRTVLGADIVMSRAYGCDREGCS
jgi:hypothetical protein